MWRPYVDRVSTEFTIITRATRISRATGTPRSAFRTATEAMIAAAGASSPATSSPGHSPGSFLPARPCPRSSAPSPAGLGVPRPCLLAPAPAPGRQPHRREPPEPDGGERPAPAVREERHRDAADLRTGDLQPAAPPAPLQPGAPPVQKPRQRDDE